MAAPPKMTGPAAKKSAASKANSKKSVDNDQAGPSEATSEEGDEASEDDKVVKTNAEWKRQLTPKQYRVTRLKDTDPPFTGAYARSKKDGIYECICCKQKLFDSKAKFESGTGWPSFFDAINKKAVAYHPDTSMGVLRTEVVCSRCDAHLGHVFEDGPPPTGLRFCTNSSSLKFISRSSLSEKKKDSETKDAARKDSRTKESTKKQVDKQKSPADSTQETASAKVGNGKQTEEP